MSPRRPPRADDVRHVDQPMIVCRGVAKWYGRVVGVNDLSLEIGPGITGLLGPNGAGKSTLLKLLTGQLAPSRGELLVLGEPPSRSRAVMRRLGYCPEHEGTYEELTGLELLTFLTELHGFSPVEARQRGEAALAELGLAEAQHRRLGEYSKGMRQRAKLAQAFAHQPDVLLLDEPLTGCDPLARVQVIAAIKRLGAGPRCVVVSSHVLHEIEAMTSEILLMHKGQVVAEGNVYAIRELIDRHPHRIRVECDRPRELARALVGDPGVLRLALEEGAVIVETRQPDDCYPMIPRLAREAGIRIAALTSPDNNLQAVFRYLTEEARPRAGVQEPTAGGAS